MKKLNKIQNNYAKALAAFETAKNGYEAELVSTGLRARIDAANTNAELDVIAIEDEPIFKRWNVKKLEKALTKSEDALIEWSLNVAISMRPARRVEMLSLLDTMKQLTRHDERKAECLRLAMTLPA